MKKNIEKLSDNIKSVKAKDLVVGQVYCDMNSDVDYSSYLLFVNGDDGAVRFKFAGGFLSYITHKGLIEFCAESVTPFFITPKCNDLMCLITNQ